MSELAFMPASEIAQRVARRELSAVEVMRATLARVDKLQPALNCFITVCADDALRDAAVIDQRVMRGESVGPLCGVPLHVKDLVDTAGVRTTFGSLMHETNVPKADAVSVARLKKAGAVLFGKTTTPEFGHMVWTEAPLFGQTRNAWDQTRTSGGSSGGAAVACAAGLGPIGIGTCAGGSTRIPAACNGVVGFKQSLGLIPHDMAAESFANMSYITPMTRTVRDTALMLEAMAGPHPADVHSFRMSAEGCVDAVDAARDLKGLRIAWRPFLGNTVIDSEVLRLTETAAQTFAQFGAELHEMVDDMDPTEPMWLVLSTALWNARFSHLLPEWQSRMSPTLVRQMLGGAMHSAEALQRAHLERTKLYRKIQGWFDHADIIIMPTLTRTAMPLREALFEPIEIEDRKIDTVRKAWFPYTHPFNLSGNPAVTLPAGFHSDGLPVAIQMVARRGADALLCRAAALFEQARPWGGKVPAIAQT